MRVCNVSFAARKRNRASGADRNGAGGIFFSRRSAIADLGVVAITLDRDRTDDIDDNVAGIGAEIVPVATITDLSIGTTTNTGENIEAGACAYIYVPSNRAATMNTAIADLGVATTLSAVRERYMSARRDRHGSTDVSPEVGATIADLGVVVVAVERHAIACNNGNVAAGGRFQLSAAVADLGIVQLRAFTAGHATGQRHTAACDDVYIACVAGITCILLIVITAIADLGETATEDTGVEIDVRLGENENIAAPRTVITDLRISIGAVEFYVIAGNRRLAAGAADGHIPDEDRALIGSVSRIGKGRICQQRKIGRLSIPTGNDVDVAGAGIGNVAIDIEARCGGNRKRMGTIVVAHLPLETSIRIGKADEYIATCAGGGAEIGCQKIAEEIAGPCDYRYVPGFRVTVVTVCRISDPWLSVIATFFIEVRVSRDIERDVTTDITCARRSQIVIDKEQIAIANLGDGFRRRAGEFEIAARYDMYIAADISARQAGLIGRTVANLGHRTASAGRHGEQVTCFHRHIPANRAAWRIVADLNQGIVAGGIQQDGAIDAIQSGNVNLSGCRCRSAAIADQHQRAVFIAFKIDTAAGGSDRDVAASRLGEVAKIPDRGQSQL